MSSQPEPALDASALRDAIPLGRFPWIRPLVQAYSHDFASVASLFAGNPADPSAWRAAIQRVRDASRHRTRVADVITQQLERRQAPPAARDAARALAAEGSVAIVTGQQAGLFGGPVYTLLKAVTAIQLAQHVRQTYGVEAVPVFWVDAEDHDWNEVATATVLDRDFNTAHLTPARPQGAGVQPVGSLTFDEGITATIATLRDTLAPTEFTADVVDALNRHYRPGARAGAAFAGWLETLLGAHGLVVFESDDPAAKACASDVFVRELEHPGQSATLVRTAAVEMRGLGHEPQVEPAEGAVCLFYVGTSGRQTIKCEAGVCTIGDTARPLPDLLDEARTHPERFSPNVVLRPLVQDRLLPTVCYVGGPSELAYQAQLGALYRRFDVAAPLLYSRASATLLDSAATRFLSRAGLPLEALQVQDESVLNRLLEAQLPPAIEEIIETATREMAAHGDALKRAVATFDATLTGAVETTVDRVSETLRTLQGKLVQATKKKDDTLRRQFFRTRALTFPDGHPQERALNVAFFTNRYGLRLADRLLETLPTDTKNHYVLTL